MTIRKLYLFNRTIIIQTMEMFNRRIMIQTWHTNTIRIPVQAWLQNNKTIVFRIFSNSKIVQICYRINRRILFRILNMQIILQHKPKVKKMQQLEINQMEKKIKVNRENLIFKIVQYIYIFFLFITNR